MREGPTDRQSIIHSLSFRVKVRDDVCILKIINFQSSRYQDIRRHILRIETRLDRVNIVVSTSISLPPKIVSYVIRRQRIYISVRCQNPQLLHCLALEITFLSSQKRVRTSTMSHIIIFSSHLRVTYDIQNNNICGCRLFFLVRGTYTSFRSLCIVGQSHFWHKIHEMHTTWLTSYVCIHSLFPRRYSSQLWA